MSCHSYAVLTFGFVRIDPVILADDGKVDNLLAAYGIVSSAYKDPDTNSLLANEVGNKPATSIVGVDEQPCRVGIWPVEKGASFRVGL